MITSALAVLAIVVIHGLWSKAKSAEERRLIAESNERSIRACLEAQEARLEKEREKAERKAQFDADYLERRTSTFWSAT
jgi:hypothetical protein